MESYILTGDVFDKIKEIPDGIINTCVTSPPYWGLRDYGTAEWEGGNPECDHGVNIWEGEKQTQGAQSGHASKNDRLDRSVCKCGAVKIDNQLGLEKTPEEFIDKMVKVFREVRRVLRDDGTLWLNLGDSYSGSGGAGNQFGQLEKEGFNKYKQGGSTGLKPKDLVGIPWRVALALQADGWYLRQDIIWHKPNPMPESVKDRCTKAHEYIFLLSKSPKYYYDYEAIKEPASYLQPNSPESIKSPHGQGFTRKAKGNRKTFRGGGKYTNNQSHDNSDLVENDSVGNTKETPLTRNKRSVWTVSTKPFSGAHFATFPPELIEPCIKAGSPLYTCSECGEPYIRDVETTRIRRDELPKSDPRYRPNRYKGSYEDINGKGDAGYSKTIDKGFIPTCKCNSHPGPGGIVLDPFFGAGTTGVVAYGLSRKYIGIELKPFNTEMAENRIKYGTVKDEELSEEKKQFQMEF